MGGFFSGGIFILIVFIITLINLRPSLGGLLIGNQNLILDETGINSSGKNFHQSFNWEIIGEVEIFKSILVIRVDGVAGQIVPLNAFKSKKEEQIFIKAIPHYGQLDR